VVKKNWRSKFDEVRQRFRLTPTEKRIAVFVLAAFVLGLATKCYRDAHPSASLLQPHKTRTKFASPAPGSTPARKRNGKANTNRESGRSKSDVGSGVKVRVKNQKPCPHISFAKTVVPQIISV
jgi:hypothetical protein